jgi:hypothetical protein
MTRPSDSNSLASFGPSESGTGETRHSCPANKPPDGMESRTNLAESAGFTMNELMSGPVYILEITDEKCARKFSFYARNSKFPAL